MMATKTITLADRETILELAATQQDGLPKPNFDNLPPTGWYSRRMYQTPGRKPRRYLYYRWKAADGSVKTRSIGKLA